MTGYQSGQEVEVLVPTKRTWLFGDPRHWRRARIIKVTENKRYTNTWRVRFQDGTFGVFDGDYIRPVRSFEMMR